MKITVYKFDPSIDAAPYYIDGEVPFKEKMTAMEALLYFHRNIAPVNYDSSCGGRLCVASSRRVRRYRVPGGLSGG